MEIIEYFYFMDAKYLDTILEVLKDQQPQSLAFTDYMCNPRTKSKYETSARLELRRLGYIFETDTAPCYIGITGAGLLFLNQGGFQKEAKLKDLPFDTVKYAKHSRNISIVAIALSVIAIAVTVWQSVNKAS